MKNNLKFPLLLLAIVLGYVIFKHFNFDIMAVKKPWLDTLYVVVFIGLLMYIFKKNKYTQE